MTEKAEQSLQKALMSILTQIWNFNSEAIVRTLLDNDILEVRRYLYLIVAILLNLAYDQVCHFCAGL